MSDEKLSTPKGVDSHGLTVRERQVLTMTRDHPEATGKDMAGVLDVSKVRVHQIRKNLIEKGMLDGDYRLTDEGKEAISG